MSKPDSDQYNAKETQQRMDDALRRALNTPPKPHAQMKGNASPKPAKQSKPAKIRAPKLNKGR